MTSSSSYAQTRGLAAAENFRRGGPGGSLTSTTATSTRAAGLSSQQLQARADARERSSLNDRHSGVGYSTSNVLLRGGEHAGIGSADRDLHDRDNAGQALRDVPPRPEGLLRHRSDGSKPLFPALSEARGSGSSAAAAAAGAAEGITDVGISAARRRRGQTSTPPACPPPPTHLLPSPPPPFGPSSLFNHGSAGGNAAHGSAGSRSLPPGRNNRPQTPSGQLHPSRRDDAVMASRMGPNGVSHGSSLDAGRDSLGARGAGHASEASSRSRSVAATGSVSNGGNSREGICDKCDGKHPTERCPHFKGDREKHKDAWVNYGKKSPLQMGGNGGNFVLKSARVVKQPGDGSCLFHSLAHGLSFSGGAGSLRREIAGFVQQNPSLEIAGDTIEEWVRWDSSSSVNDYARRMSISGWGGGIEMAACSHMKNVNVHVYENSARNSRGCGTEFKRISCFDNPNATRTIHVLYQGGVHYDALVPA